MVWDDCCRREVLAQALLGGQVVRQLLHYWLPVLHASFAQIVFAAVLSIAVFTSEWWISERPQLEDRGTPSIHSLAILNAAVIYLQVILGAGFRHKEIPIWPHMAGAMLVLGMVLWTAVALRKRFSQSRELSKARMLLHAIFGTQFLLGLGAYCRGSVPRTRRSRCHHGLANCNPYGRRRDSLRVSVLVVLTCYRLIPRGREVPTTAPGQVTTG